MNEEGEQVKAMQCPFCIHLKDSPDCMYQERGKCAHFTQEKKQ